MPSLVIRNNNYVRNITSAGLGRHPIAASQTFKIGDVLTESAGGLAQQAVAASAAIPAVSGITNLILGVAVEDAQPLTGDISVQPSVKTYAFFVRPHLTLDFYFPIYHATATSAYPVATQLGAAGYEMNNQAFPAAVGGQTMYCVAIAGTTDKKVQIIGYDGDDFPGWPDYNATAFPATPNVVSQYCRAQCKFIQSVCAGGI